jgi:hypothetical protein
MEDQAKPCPICQMMLMKGINIIPIYGSEQPLRTSSDGIVTNSDTNDVPRRPNLPPRITPRAAPARPVLEKLPGTGSVCDRAHSGIFEVTARNTETMIKHAIRMKYSSSK